MEGIMIQRVLLAALIAALAIPAAGLAAQVIAAGTAMDAKLNVALDTKTSYAGQPISMTVLPPYPDGNPAFDNARIYGHVTSVVSGGQGRNPQLSIALDSIRYPDSSANVPLNAKVTNIAQQRKNNALKEIGGTVAGMVVGNIIGKWIGMKGITPGAIGAVAGYLLASNNKTDFHVPAGSGVGIQLTNNLAVR
jgi:hypothetical protein